MHRVVSLYRSSVGKKILMALSGLILFGFIVAHMVGNLKVLTGPDSMNEYAEWIRAVGSPIMPDGGTLWALRLVLLGAVGVHVWAALDLWSTSRKARDRGYTRGKDLSFSYASRTMRWGGVIILLFVVYHILHFTTGQAHTDFIHGNVYHNFVTAFTNPWVLLVYVVAQAALCLHLYHGLWSATQTLGANHPKYDRWRRPAAAVFSVAIFVGFVLPPLMVMVGAIR